MSMNTPIQLPPDVTPTNKNLMVAFPVTLSDGTTSLIQAVVLADASGNVVTFEEGAFVTTTPVTVMPASPATVAREGHRTVRTRVTRDPKTHEITEIIEETA